MHRNWKVYGEVNPTPARGGKKVTQYILMHYTPEKLPVVLKTSGGLPDIFTTAAIAQQWADQLNEWDKKLSITVRQQDACMDMINKLCGMKKTLTDMRRSPDRYKATKDVIGNILHEIDEAIEWNISLSATCDRSIIEVCQTAKNEANYKPRYVQRH